MKYETEDLDNLVEGLKTWESLKGPKKEGMKVEFTAHANDVRFHFTWVVSDYLLAYLQGFCFCWTSWNDTVMSGATSTRIL